MTREDAFPQSERSTVRRQPQRSSARRAAILEILREAYVCHVAWSEQQGPVVIPMGFGLWGEELVLHGSGRSRLVSTLAKGSPIAVAVTLLDGLVLARSAFHSSMNYRSVVLFGRCRAVESRDEKRRALDAFTDHVVPGRSAVARPMTDEEINGTAVLAFRIEEATAKVRQGPPSEPAADRRFPVWAGVVPLELRAGEPEDAPDLASPSRPPAPARRRRAARWSSGVAEQPTGVVNPAGGARS